MMQAFQRLTLAAILACGLSACSGGSGSGNAPSRTADAASCGADRLAHVVGKPLTSLPGDEVEGAMRLIRPDTAMTRDFNPQRLNVSLSAQDVITQVTCG